jgi:hypothetical protein
MNRHWRPFGRAALALLVVASLMIVVVHWHRDSRGLDCGLCAVQHMPTLQSPTGNLLIVPTTLGWMDVTDKVASIYSGAVLLYRGRAPPSVFFSI